MHPRRPEPGRDATLERRAMKRRKCFWIVGAGQGGSSWPVCVRVVVPARVRLLAVALGRRGSDAAGWGHAAEERVQPELAVVG